MTGAMMSVFMAGIMGLMGRRIFRTNSYDEQKTRIVKAIAAIENVTGCRPIMNRCPDLWLARQQLKYSLRKDCYWIPRCLLSELLVEFEF